MVLYAPWCVIVTLAGEPNHRGAFAAYQELPAVPPELPRSRRLLGVALLSLHDAVLLIGELAQGIAYLAALGGGWMCTKHRPYRLAQIVNEWHHRLHAACSVTRADAAPVGRLRLPAASRVVRPAH